MKIFILDVFDVIYVSMFICLKYMDFRIVEFEENS